MQMHTKATTPAPSFALPRERSVGAQTHKLNQFQLGLASAQELDGLLCDDITCREAGVYRTWC